MNEEDYTPTPYTAHKRKTNDSKAMLVVVTLAFLFCFVLLIILDWYAAIAAYFNSFCIYQISKFTCQASHLTESLSYSYLHSQNY